MTHTTPHVLTDRLAAAYTKALIHHPDDTVYNNTDRAINDTPLALAAPFLLEALQECLEAMTDGGQVEPDSYMKAIRMAEEAIRKATV